MTIPRPTYNTQAAHRALVHSYPVALLTAFAMLIWMQHRHHQTTKDYTHLQNLVASFFHSASNDAQEAFDNGDFQRAAALLDPAGSGARPEPATLLLRARALECLGYFPEAAKAYATLENLPGKHLAVMRGQKFCQRMASERSPSRIPSHEALYRLHEELMRRGDAASARFIARKLAPDMQPLRESLYTLLRALDPEIQVSDSEEAGLVNVTTSHWQPQMLDLLHDLRIGTLNIAQSGLQDPRILATLDVRQLNLEGNRVGDLTSLRALPLRSLRLDYTNVADARPLAGMPLRELHLAHTMISSLQPLALCPLQSLDLSYTAIHSIEPLRGMELRSLDLSHTHISDLTPLAGMPLERLVLNDTEVHDLHAIAGARLKSLSLVGTPIKDLDALAGMPITELDLRGCELLTDVAVLAHCPLLEHIYLPRHIQAPADRWHLPRLKFIEYERHPASAIAQK